MNTTASFIYNWKDETFENVQVSVSTWGLYPSYWRDTPILTKATMSAWLPEMECMIIQVF